MRSREVTVVGAGYVGLVAGVCLATSGHQVTVIDSDESRLSLMGDGRAPFYEPGLDDLLQKALDSGRLGFARAEGFSGYGEFVVVAVGTPSTSTGSSDLRYVNAVIDSIAASAGAGTIVVMKSTVPPGTGSLLAARLVPLGIRYISNPEFLREGSAVEDWFKTDRMVLGGASDAVALVAELYEDIDAPLVLCDIASAELIKYASNAFLAMKISFANEIANLCDRVGADVEEVVRGVGMDSRIGGSFLNAGIGYGGSCFPKDTRALDYLYSISGYHSQLLKAVIDVNAYQRRLPAATLRQHIGDLNGRVVAVLGLTFKPNTDDTREAPARDIINMLLVEGASVKGYDPIGSIDCDSRQYVQERELKDAVAGADAVIICTEWPEILSADWEAMSATLAGHKIVFDGRNCLDPESVRRGGGTYIGVGRR